MPSPRIPAKKRITSGAKSLTSQKESEAYEKAVQAARARAKAMAKKPGKK
jgi:hypothetical protein